MARRTLRVPHNSIHDGRRDDLLHGWHLDRRIPLAMIMTILVQCGALLLWGSGVSHEIGNLKQDVAVLKSDAKATSAAISAAIVDLATLRTEVKYLVAQQEQLQQAIDRMLTTYKPARPAAVNGRGRLR